jgi:hypothetical protein
VLLSLRRVLVTLQVVVLGVKLCGRAMRLIPEALLADS